MKEVNSGIQSGYFAIDSEGVEPANLSLIAIPTVDEVESLILHQLHLINVLRYLVDLDSLHLHHVLLEALER